MVFFTAVNTGVLVFARFLGIAVAGLRSIPLTDVLHPPSVVVREADDSEPTEQLSLRQIVAMLPVACIVVRVAVVFRNRVGTASRGVN